LSINKIHTTSHYWNNHLWTISFKKEKSNSLSLKKKIVVTLNTTMKRRRAKIKRKKQFI